VYRAIPTIRILSLHDALPILIKVGSSPSLRIELMNVVNNWGRILDMGESTATAQIIGTPDNIDKAIAELGQFGIIEIARTGMVRSEEHTSELQSRENLVCRLL